MSPAAIRAHDELMTRVVEPEWLDWYRMMPRERWAAQDQMWATYRLLGGSLDDMADSDAMWCPPDAERRSRIRSVRRDGL